MQSLEIPTVREALASYLDSQVKWRKEKAKEFPQDARNAQSASGLEELAAYVRKLADDAPILTRFATIVSAFCPGGDVFTPPYDPDSGVSRSGDEAGRYSFGHKDSPERFLADFVQTVETEASEVAQKWANIAA